MAKAKFDFRNLEIPAPAQKPFYAGVGAGDLAVTAAKEYVADVQKRVSGLQKDAQSRVADVQKTVSNPKGLRDSAVETAKARRTAVQSAVEDGVDQVTSTYTDLAKRGEAVVRGTKLPSTATVEVKVNTTNPAAKKGPKKAPATKSTAKKAPAKKSTARTTTARKTTAKKSS